MSPVQGVDTALHSQAQLLLLLLLYAIKQVLDTNTETAEPHSAQWAQSGHWPPNMRDPDETAASAQCIYIIYTL